MDLQVALSEFIMDRRRQVNPPVPILPCHNSHTSVYWRVPGVSWSAVRRTDRWA
jgi:hypothetical protein